MPNLKTWSRSIGLGDTRVKTQVAPSEFFFVQAVLPHSSPPHRVSRTGTLPTAAANSNLTLVTSGGPTLRARRSQPQLFLYNPPPQLLANHGRSIEHAAPAFRPDIFCSSYASRKK
jgi:hypothetical protein